MSTQVRSRSLAICGRAAMMDFDAPKQCRYISTYSVKSIFVSLCDEELAKDGAYCMGGVLCCNNSVHVIRASLRWQ